MDNEAGIATGWLPGRLSDLGRRLATPFPGGQSYQDVVRQTADLLRELADGSDDTRVLLIAHTANQWALEHLLHGVPLENLVDTPFNWRPGWEYDLPSGWGR